MKRNGSSCWLTAPYIFEKRPLLRPLLLASCDWNDVAVVAASSSRGDMSIVSTSAKGSGVPLWCQKRALSSCRFINYCETGLTFCKNRLLSYVGQQSEAKEAVERRIVCGAVTGTSCVRCSGYWGSTSDVRWWFVPVSGRKGVLRVCEHLHWRYIYTDISLLSQVGKPGRKAALAPLIQGTFAIGTHFLAALHPFASKVPILLNPPLLHISTERHPRPTRANAYHKEQVKRNHPRLKVLVWKRASPPASYG